MSIRVECTGCHAVLEVKDALAGQQGACPKCGGTIQVPGARTGTSAPSLTDATGPEMLAELRRRKKSAVLIVFDSPASGDYELSRQAGANVRCYSTADMDNQKMMQVLGEVGRMSQGQATSKGGVGLTPEGPTPFELKGDHVGSTLAAFKKKYDRTLGAGLQAPFCSDSFPGQANEQLNTEPWHYAAGIVHARIDLPSEGASPTVGGVETEKLIYQFVDSRLFRISALFDTDSFHHIRQALYEKYGPANEEQQDPMQFTWRNEVSTVELQRGSIRPKKPSMLHIVHTELFRLFQSRVPTRASDL